MDIQLRIVSPEMQELKTYGYSKNHKRIDAFISGKWRVMGYYLGVKGYNALIDRIPAKIAINTGIPLKDIKLIV